MANTLDVLVPKLIAAGLLALRPNNIMPRVVNRGFDRSPGDRGSTVTIPIPSAIAVQDVTPGPYPPSTADIAPTSVTMAMTTWKEAPFYLTDVDIQNIVDNNIFPMQGSEAVKAMGRFLDQSVWALYKQIYGFAGTPGTTPFASGLNEFVDARKVLGNQFAPADERRCVLGENAEANALLIRAIQDASWRNSTTGIVDGQIGRVLGADWFKDQDNPTHTVGTWYAGTGYLINHGGGYAIGDSVLTVDTGSGKAALGDVVTFAGHSQTYTVLAHTDTDPETQITVSPALVAAVADNAAITIKNGGEVNLVIHRDCMSLGMRPFADSSVMAGEVGGGRFLSMVDELTGIVMRVEVTREHKRYRYSYDTLSGTAVPRPQLGARLMG